VKLERVQQLAVFYEPQPDHRHKVGRLAIKQRQILFEYEPEFLGSQLELSPFHLPLRRGVVVGGPVLDGLMGCSMTAFRTDLTFAQGPGGEHTMLVAGEGRAPDKDHLTRLAGHAELRGASKIIDEVRAATSRFQVFADEAGVPKKAAKQVLQVLRGPMR
jgi:hypothetical protein